MPWTSVRVLHARASALYDSLPEEKPEAEREADSQGYRGKHVPLHGLSKHLEGYSDGCGRNGEAVADGGQVQRRLHGEENPATGLRFFSGPESLLPTVARLSGYGDS